MRAGVHHMGGGRVHTAAMRLKKEKRKMRVAILDYQKLEKKSGEKKRVVQGGGKKMDVASKNGNKKKKTQGSQNKRVRTFMNDYREK